PAARRYLGPGYDAMMSRGGMDSFTQNVAGMGIPAPRLMAWGGMLAELGGGALIILGLKTRLAALAPCANQGSAIFPGPGTNGLVGQGATEFPVALTGALLALVLAGPGALSIDGDE